LPWAPPANLIVSAAAESKGAGKRERQRAHVGKASKGEAFVQNLERRDMATEAEKSKRESKRIEQKEAKGRKSRKSKRSGTDRMWQHSNRKNITEIK